MWTGIDEYLIDAKYPDLENQDKIKSNFKIFKILRLFEIALKNNYHYVHGI